MAGREGLISPMHPGRFGPLFMIYLSPRTVQGIFRDATEVTVVLQGRRRYSRLLTVFPLR